MDINNLIDEIYNQVDDKITDLAPRELTEMEYHRLRYDIGILLKSSGENFMFELMIGWVQDKEYPKLTVEQMQETFNKFVPFKGEVPECLKD